MFSAQQELGNTAHAHGDDLRDTDYGTLQKVRRAMCRRITLASGGEPILDTLAACVSEACGCLPVGLRIERIEKSEEADHTQSRRRQLVWKEGKNEQKVMSETLETIGRAPLMGAVDEMEENIVGSWLQVAAGDGADGELSLALAGRVSAAVGSTKNRRSRGQKCWDYAEWTDYVG